MRTVANYNKRFSRQVTGKKHEKYDNLNPAVNHLRINGELSVPFSSKYIDVNRERNDSEKNTHKEKPSFKIRKSQLHKKEKVSQAHFCDENTELVQSSVIEDGCDSND